MGGVSRSQDACRSLAMHFCDWLLVRGVSSLGRQILLMLGSAIVQISGRSARPDSDKVAHLSGV